MTKIHNYKWPDQDDENFDERDKFEGSVNKERPHHGRKNFEGIGPRGYKRSDARVEEEVCEKLARDKYIDASEIIVSVSDGVVKLDGSVNNREDRVSAETLIENIWGIERVDNNITVKRNGKEHFDEPRH